MIIITSELICVCILTKWMFRSWLTSGNTLIAGWKDEEGTTPPDAVDLICDAEWQADQHHDDQGEPYRQSVPHEGKAPDGPKPGTDRKVQTPIRAGIRGEQRQVGVVCEGAIY